MYIQVKSCHVRSCSVAELTALINVLHYIMIKKYVMQIKSLRPSVVSFTTDFKLLMPGCAENKIKKKCLKMMHQFRQIYQCFYTVIRHIYDIHVYDMCKKKQKKHKASFHTRIKSITYFSCVENILIFYFFDIHVYDIC